MKTVAMIMAGGAGTRLSVLSDFQAKPAVAFAGKYRIIDFTLSNCVNSDIYQVAILTQYRPHTLNRHVGIGKPWDLDRRRGGLELRHPYVGRESSDWYKGTADAVSQNLDFVEKHKADLVLILSGDHIYKMDYRPLIDFHLRNKADLTVGVITVPLEETHRFGIMTVDAEMRVTEFTEKPKSKDKGTLASMGIYIFNAGTLVSRLRGSQDQAAKTDFGQHIIPEMIRSDRVYAYPFNGYWVDVGTIQAYWETNMQMTTAHPPLDLYDTDWLIRTLDLEKPPAKIGPQGSIQQSLVSNGCMIRGTVIHSVLSPGVYVSPGAVVKDSIILNDTFIGPGSVIDRSILANNVLVGAGVIVGDGQDMTPNLNEPDKLNSGVTVIGEKSFIPDGVRLGRNVLVHVGRTESDFKQSVYSSGETI